jgi:hypothetical protein
MFVVEDITFDHRIDLPDHVQYVHISRAKVTEAQLCDFVSRLPSSVNSLTITASRLKTFPDTHHLPCLEFLDLHDNEINHLNCTFSNAIRALDLSNNCIKDITCEFPLGIVELDLSWNRLSKHVHTLRHHIDTTVNYSENNFIVKKTRLILPSDPEWDRPSTSFTPLVYDPDNLDPYLLPRHPLEVHRSIHDRNGTLIVSTGTTFDNGENVHLSSVQRSLKASFERLKAKERFDDLDLYTLLKYRPGVAESRDRGVRNRWYRAVARFICCAPRISRDYEQMTGSKYTKEDGVVSSDTISIFGHRASELVERDLLTDTRHSILGATYAEVLRTVLLAVERMDDDTRPTLLSILEDEIISGMGLCFTGRISRLVNALAGICPDVTVSIGKNEEINNSIIALTRQGIVDDELYARVVDLLVELCIEDRDMVGWLEALP